MQQTSGKLCTFQIRSLQIIHKVGGKGGSEQTEGFYDCLLKQAIVHCHCQNSIVLLLSVSDQYEGLTEHISKSGETKKPSEQIQISNVQSPQFSRLSPQLPSEEPPPPLPSLNPRAELRQAADHCNVRPRESQLIRLIPSRRVNPESVKPTGAASPD